MTKTAEQQRAERAIERAKAAGWQQSANGRVLLDVLARRAAGTHRQMSVDEIWAETKRRQAAARG